MCAHRFPPAESAPSPGTPAAGGAGSPAGGPVGGRFAIGERIGGGNTGEVFSATDAQTGQPCVVKRIDPGVFDSPMLLQRCERELKQLEKLSSESIARVLAHGKDGDQLWLAMERAEGYRALDDLVTESGALDVARASGLVAAIGAALSEAARVGVIHRDLAPKNVLVGPGDRVKLINFSVPVPTPTVPGVPEFVAPELIEGKPVDQRTNIYSLGAIYYYVLTGQPPYLGDPDSVHQQHLAGEVAPPSQHVALPAEVDALVLKSLERATSKRFMTLRQLLAEVEKVGGAAGDGAAGSTQPMGRVGAPNGQSAPARPAAAPNMAKTMMGMGAIDVTTSGAGGVEGPATPAAGGDSGVMTMKLGSAAAQARANADGAAAPEPEAPAVATPEVAVPQPAPAPPPAHEGAAQAPVAPQPVAEVVAQAPAPAAPPQAVAPQQAAAPAGGKGKGKSGGSPALSKPKAESKGKFRETMWFKKGELDIAAAEAAAAERARTGHDAAPDRADSLPVEDRYGDDGSLTATDAEKFSLKTGATQMMPAFRLEDQQKAASAPGLSEEELIGEMKGGRGKVIAAIVVGVILIIAVIVYAATAGGGGDEEGAGSDEAGETAPAATPGAAPGAGASPSGDGS